MAKELFMQGVSRAYYDDKSKPHIGYGEVDDTLKVKIYDESDIEQAAEDYKQFLLNKFAIWQEYHEGEESEDDSTD